MPAGDQPDAIDDRMAQYLIAIGDVCSAAERASLEVSLVTAAGTTVVGVPYPHEATRGNELDDTGYARTFRVNDALVNLDEIVALTVRAPDGSHPS
jgi:hypothetical protein